MTTLQAGRAIIASLTQPRSNGFFVMFRGDGDNGSEWKFVIPGSLHWDSLHQDIYFAHHDLEPCPKEISDRLPELPPVPEFKGMERGGLTPLFSGQPRLPAGS